jgi:hypothetical protein
MNSVIRGWRYRLPVGVSLGLAAAAIVLSVWPSGAGVSPGVSGAALLSDCDGTIRQLVMHYTDEAADTVIPTYREFLRQLPAGVIVHVVCPETRTFDNLVAAVPGTQCTLSPVIVNHPITSWSRDRWLALGTPADPRTVLWYPRGEDGAGVWPARAGDQRVATDLAAAVRRKVLAQPADLDFDGGDFAADNETAFVRPAIVLRNLQRTVATRAELVARLSDVLKRRIVLFEEAPEHHTAMYLMPVGQRTVLVGDPRLAERLLAESPEKSAVDAYLPGGTDFTEATAARFDAVVAQCQAAGYRVVRIPLVPAADGRTYITYVNAILDQRENRRIVYMPVFRCAETLNQAAAAVWSELGYEVRPVDCDACARQFGTLHCLVNVLRRD